MMLKQRQGSLTDIKRRFEPLYGYIVFENRLSPDENGAFEEIFDLMRRLGKKIVDSEICIDKSLKKRFLILKMKPEDNETIIQDFFDIGLPQHYTYYVYGCTVEACVEGRPTESQAPVQKRRGQ